MVFLWSFDLQTFRSKARNNITTSRLLKIRCEVDDLWYTLDVHIREVHPKMKEFTFYCLNFAVCRHSVGSGKDCLTPFPKSTGIQFLRL